MPLSTARRYPEMLPRDGRALLRIEFSPAQDDALVRSTVRIGVDGALLRRSRTCFDGFERQPGKSGEQSEVCFEIEATRVHPVISLFWLEGAAPECRIRIKTGAQEESFALQHILENGVWTGSGPELQIFANLQDETRIGKIEPVRLGIADPGTNFDIVVLADPQGGDPKDRSNGNPTRLKIHNAFIEESLYTVSQLPRTPAFAVVIGDIVDHQGQSSNFRVMADFLKKLPCPVLFGLGNHEIAYGVEHPPEDPLRGYGNYFAAQREINGSDKLLYSFDLGQWHFVVWPDPLRSRFWETHSHYFDWLERDLERHRKTPVLFLQHVPLHPIGINPFINYVEPVEIRRRLLDILSCYGNVKYVLSGHVHIPIRASLKTAVSYRGMKLINLPAAGYRPRGFGEGELNGGPSQGVAVLSFRGRSAELSYRTVTGETVTYPDELPEFEPARHPLWLNRKWELPAERRLVNGGFEDGLTGWCRRFVYTEDQNPSNLCEVRTGDSPAEPTSLYLFCRKRGYDCPGQDRLPQSINRLCQAVLVSDGRPLLLRLAYRIDPDHYDADAWSGAYLWIEGFESRLKRLNVIYSAGRTLFSPGGKESQSGRIAEVHFDLPVLNRGWHHAVVNPVADFRRGAKLDPGRQINLDRLVFNLGVWTANTGDDQRIGIHFSGLALEGGDAPSRIQGRPAELKKNGHIFRKRIDHLAGEHVYVDRRSGTWWRR